MAPTSTMHTMSGADKRYARHERRGQALWRTWIWLRQAGPEPGPGQGTDAYTGRPLDPGGARLRRRSRNPDPGPAQTQTQTQAQTRARPPQRAPIAAGSLKWQSHIRSLIGKWQILKGRQNWIFKVWVPAAALEIPRGGQSRLQF